jgi:predicted acylesterase/phospholipase RssA
MVLGRALFLRVTLLAAGMAFVLAGCASTIVRNGIANPRIAETATVPGIPGVRFWADDVPADAIAEVRRRTPNMPPVARDAKRIGGRPVVETLALSGGGADGAFGAGVLAGWTARGDRPEFEIVTGVSAGAIIAPFAYLGAAHDADLKQIWTQYQQSEVITAQILPGLFGGASLTDTTPLAGLVAKYVDRAMLDKVAAEYKRGRILLVLTTNLDAQRPVVWNMGEIAMSRDPRALDLFRKVILASAAIPAAFPPVQIEVEAGGKLYDELHVDGGTTRELFISPVQAPLKAFDALFPAPPVRRIFIIKNGKVTPEAEVVNPTTLQIAARSIATLVKSQNWSELYRIYRISLDAGADFNFLAVPASFSFQTKEIYDPKYQAALYDEGIAAGRAGVWMKTPPGQTPIAVPAKKAGKAAPAKAPEKIPRPPNDAPVSGWQPKIIPAEPPAKTKPGQPVAAAG